MPLRIIAFIGALFLTGFGYMYYVVLSSPKPDAKALFEANFTNPLGHVQALNPGGYSTIFGTSRAWLTFKASVPLQLRNADQYKPSDTTELKRYLPKDCGAVLDQPGVQNLMWYDQAGKRLKLYLQSPSLSCYYEQRERGAK
jgi:hypothetical protein